MSGYATYLDSSSEIGTSTYAVSRTAPTLVTLGGELRVCCL